MSREIIPFHIADLPEPGGLDFASMIPRLEGDWAVTSDWHLPYFSRRMMVALVETARRMDVRRLLIAGDLFDFTYLSDYVVYADDRATSIERDIAMVRDLFGRLVPEHFDEVFIIPGNHDRRLSKALREKIGVVPLFKLFTPEALQPRITAGIFPTVEIESGGEPFRVVHPKSFSKDPTKVASQLTLIHRCHVISAHGHHFGMVVGPDGHHLAIDSGGLFDPRRINYLYFGGDTTHGKWAGGFVIVRGGDVTLHNGKNTGR